MSGSMIRRANIKRKIILALFVLLMLASLLIGCATYPAVATFQDYNEVLYGQLNTNLLVGASDFSMEGKVKGLKCNGISKVTYIPPFGQCIGQRGDIFATCTDGRSITGEWVAQSCASGYWRGKDSNGNIFAFNFGPPDE